MNDEGARILVIDDESQIRKLLKVSLSAHGYKVADATSGQEGLDQAANFHPDLIILDLGLLDMEGKEVVTQLREWLQTPIIILSVRNQDNDKIEALDAGADDYLTKPFSMGELLARVRVSLRHVAKKEDEPVLKLGDLTIDLAVRRVFAYNKEIKLTPIEYDILKNLALNAGKVLTHKQLLRTIWGKDYEDESQYLRVYIGQLRRKIEEHSAQPKFIITEPGIGYRLAFQE